MNEAEIFNYLTQSGLAPHQAAGVMGNISQEAGFDPRAVNPKSGAFGLFQHLGPRLAALHDFARQSGRPVDDARTQLDFAIHELNGPEARARASLMGADTPESAALAFSHDFERAGKAERADRRRTTYARALLDHMMQKWGMPALNALVPPAQADERPAQDDWEDVDAGPVATGVADDGWEDVDAGPVAEAPPAPVSGVPGFDFGDPGDFREGMAREAERQIVGAQQIGSDVARWVSGEIGQPKSEYRQRVDRHGAELNAQAGRAGIMEKTGSALLPIFETAIIPSPAGIGPRFATNAAVGAGLSALEPASDEQERLERAGRGAVVGAVVPQALSGGGKLVAYTGGAVRGIVSPKHGAARELRAKLDTDFGGKFGGGGGGGGGGEIPPTIPGNPSNIPGVRYSVGMLTDNPALLALEKTARVRNGDLFFDLDNNNKRAIYEALVEKALPPAEAQAMVDALNSETSAIREAAFQTAREHLGAPGVYTGPLEVNVDRIRTEPGLRVNRGAQALGDMAQGAIHPRARGSAAKQSAEPVEAVPLSGAMPSRDVDVESDDIITATRKLGGIDKTDFGDHWITKGFKPDPRHGPVWRANTADGRPQGRGIEDMAERLKEHGYLSPEADANDLEQLLMDAARGVADESLLWSSARSGFGNLDRGPESQHQELMGSLSDLIAAMNAKVQRPAPKTTETLPADPADLYDFRKSLADMLSSSAIAPDRMTNAVKSNRRTATGLIDSVDQGLNEASGQQWQEYLDAYKQGMAPIDEGRAIQEVLDVFGAHGHLPGTDIPNLTPGKFRQATKEKGLTYRNLGKAGWADRLSPEARSLVNDARKVLNDMENARTGPRATNGSDTGANVAGMLRQGVEALPHGGKINAALRLLDALGISSNARNLDKALLDPAEFQKVLDIVNKQRGGDSRSLANYLGKVTERLPLVINAGMR